MKPRRMKNTGFLTVTENGFGKRTVCEDFPAKSRGTMGVIAIKTSEDEEDII